MSNYHWLRCRRLFCLLAQDLLRSESVWMEILHLGRFEILGHWIWIDKERSKRLSITSRQIGKKAESFFLQIYMDSGLNTERMWHLHYIVNFFVLNQFEENSVFAPLEINPLCVSVKYFTMWPHLWWSQPQFRCSQCLSTKLRNCIPFHGIVHGESPFYIIGAFN